MVKQGFIVARLALALILSLLWWAGAAAQELYNNAPINGLIATVSGNNVSSLQLTGANWSSNYNSLYLNCSALTVSTSGNYIKMEVGESVSGWETSANYISANALVQVSTATDILNDYDSSFGMTTTSDAYLQFTINNPGSSSVYKVISGIWGGGSSNNSGYGEIAEITGWWNGDTSALTGIELVPNSGTMSGICSLYGIP